MGTSQLRGWAGELPSAAGSQHYQVVHISVEPSVVVWYDTADSR